MHIAYCEPEDCPRVSQLHVTLLSLLDLAEQHELFTVIHLKKKKTRDVTVVPNDVLNSQAQSFLF